MTTYLLDHLDLTMLAGKLGMELRTLTRNGAAYRLLSVDHFVAHDTPMVQSLLSRLDVGTTWYVRTVELNPGDEAIVGIARENRVPIWRHVSVRAAR